MIGRRIGQYEIVAEIGRGGMGTVYRARQITLNRDVALKILSAHLALDPTGLERFRREAMSVAQLAHPNIVQVYDIGEDGGVHFIAMEYVRGRTAAELLKAEGALAFRKALEICAPMAAALGVAHKAGIVHRDVKPSNILVSEAGFAKLADFGVAGLMQPPEGERLTMTGAAVGTPYYMSPEQVRGREALDGASDVYSLGVVLYELLSGAHPFGDATTAEAIIKQIQEPFPPIRRYRQDIPDELEQVLGRCLAKNRAERFQNGEELCQALEKVRLRLGFEESESGEDYRKRVSGTGFFYVDAAQKREAKATVGLRALCREMVAQARDPNKKQRRALQALYLQSVLARDEYKNSEKQLDEIKKRLKHHQGKAAQHKAQAQQLIAAGKSEEAAAAAEKEATCDRLALDYAHQAEELGKQVQELRDRYDRDREAHAEAADELALRDAEARRAGRSIPAGGDNAGLSRQARMLRYAILALTALLVVAAGCWTARMVMLPKKAPPHVVAVPAAPRQQAKPLRASLARNRGLVLHYTFDKNEVGKVSDLSGNGNDGVVNGSPTYIPQGGHDGKGAYHFASRSDCITTVETSPLDGFDALTVSAWFKLENLVWEWTPIVTKGTTDPRQRAALDSIQVLVRNDGMGWFSIQNSEGKWASIGGNPGFFRTGMWYHTVMTYDGDILRLFINGAEVNYADWTSSARELRGPMRDSAEPVRIHAYSYQMGDGGVSIDDVRIYNCALSPQEIRQLYAKTIPSPPPPPAPTDGLVLHYTFDKDEGVTVTDRSGNENDGTVHGATWVAEGSKGGAYRFDGSKDYISMGHAPSLTRLDPKGMTIAAWVYNTRQIEQRPGVNDLRDIVAQRPEGASGFGLFYGYIGTAGYVGDRINALRVSIVCWGGYEGRAIGYEIRQNRWYHIAGVFENNVGKLYINGIEETTEQGGMTGFRQTDEDVMIGRMGNCFQRLDYHDGLIDDVRVYNRALSAAEILQLYTKDPPTEPPLARMELTDGLIAYYPFSDNANDASGNGHHGVPSNVVLTNDVRGRVDSAYYFNGINAQIDCGNLITGLTQYAVCAWVKLSSFINRYYMGPWGQHDLIYMYTGLDDSFGSMFGWLDGSVMETRVTHPLPLNEWHLVTQTYDGAFVRQYDNGDLVNECAASGKKIGNAQSFVIGYTEARPGYLQRTWFHGCIDDVRIYNRALSAKEVSQLYAIMAPIPAPTPVRGFSGAGSGTPADPYQIANLTQLQEIKNNLASSYVLVADIDATPTRTWNGGAGFDPVGAFHQSFDGPSGFQGSLDGQGHTINGLFINRPTVTNNTGIGLFGFALHATIQKLGLVNVNITADNTAGALAGVFSDYGQYGTRVRQVYATGAVRGRSGVAGLVGGLYDCTVADCYSSVDVFSISDHAGGLVMGMNFSRLHRCYATGRVVVGNENAGGLLSGMLGSSSVPGHADDSFATGEVQCPGSQVGGLLGYAIGAPNVFFINSYYTDNDHQNGYGTFEANGPSAFRGRQHAVYKNWDFTNVWQEVAGAYPVLRSGRTP